MRALFGTACRTAVVASSIAAGLVCLPGDALAQRRNERNQLDTTFLFDKTGTVTLGRGSATLVVTGWDRGSVRITARGDGGSIRFEASARQVTIDPNRSDDDVTIEVQVPRGVRIVARTNSGDITVRGTRGDIDARTSSGDVAITDAREVSATSLSGDVDVRQTSGAVTVTSNNGDLEITDAHGDVDATSISGSVSIVRAVSKSVRATTTNGDVAYSGTVEPGGRYDLATHSGDIDLTLPRNASAQVSLTTWSGEIVSDVPVTLKAGSRTAPSDVTKQFTVTIGSGSARVTAETFSGDIVVTSRGGR